MQRRFRFGTQSPVEVSLLLGSLAAVGTYALLFASTMRLPWLPQVIVLLSIVVGILFFSMPEMALLTFFSLRVVIDLLWWVPVEVMSLNVMELFGGAVAALALILFYLEIKRFHRHIAMIPFIPYVVVILVGMMRNFNLREGVEILARHLSTFLLMFLVCAFMNDTRKRFRMLALFTATSAIPILRSLWDLARGNLALEMDGYFRLVGGYHNLHNHALMMMLFCTLGIFWLQHSRRIASTLIFLLYTGCAGTCLYYTYVRNAELGLLAFVAAFFLLKRRFALAAILAAGTGITVMLSPTLQDRFDDLIQFWQPETYEATRDMLGSGRWALWSTSVREFLRFPIGDIFLGLGLGREKLLTEPLYSAAYYNPTVGYIDPHNDYLSLMFQMGPTATLCYIAMQILVIREGLFLWRHGRSAWARDLGVFMAALNATVFVTSFLSNAFVSRVTLGWYFWGMAGLVFGEGLETRDELRGKEKRAAELALTHGRAAKPGAAPATLPVPAVGRRG